MKRSGWIAIATASLLGIAALATFVLLRNGSGATDSPTLPSGTAAVVHGVVESVGGDRWTTPDGRSPGSRDAAHSIYRTATIRVLEVVAGPVEGEIVVAAVNGGTVGNTSQTPGYGAPELEAGDHVVLFLAAPRDGHPYPIWYVHTAYDVEPASGLARIQFRDEPPLQLEDLVAQVRRQYD